MPAPRRGTLVSVSEADFINSGGEVTGPGSAAGGAGGGGTFSQQFNHNPVSARVPERLVRGALGTGVIVLTGPNEFILDFVQVLARPPQVVARVVMPPAVAASFAAALRDNLEKYTQSFGPPPPLPRPPQRRPTIQEIYDNLKLPEELLSGAYANAAIVGPLAGRVLLRFHHRLLPHGRRFSAGVRRRRPGAARAGGGGGQREAVRRPRPRRRRRVAPSPARRPAARVRRHSAFGDRNFKPTIPATIRPMHSSRGRSRGSPRRAMPYAAAPTAPIPVQTP